MNNTLKKWEPVVDSLRYYNTNLDTEKTAMLAEQICIFLNLGENTKIYSSYKEELKHTDFLVVMLRIYAIYQISDYEEIYKYYVKLVDSLSNDTDIIEHELQFKLQLFIKNINIYLRKDKLKKLQNEYDKS